MGHSSITAILASAALLAISFHAALLQKDGPRFEVTVSHPLAVGPIVLLALLNTYVVSRRFEVCRLLREQLISSSLQTQAIEQQSFDPLTEIYNCRSQDDIAEG
jgi:hypothetical protein